MNLTWLCAKAFRRRFRRRSGRLWCRARFNRVSEKVPEKVPGSLGAKPSQVQRCVEKVAEKVPEKILGIFGPGQVQQVQQGFQCLASQHASEQFVKIKRCGCWGYHRFFSYGYDGYHVDLMVTNGTFMILNESLMFHHTGYPPAIKRGNGQIEDFPVNT